MSSKRHIPPLAIAYQILVFYPVGIVATIIIALATIVMISLGRNANWDYYPGKVWGRLMCILALVRTETVGADNIDPTKSYIFAANHQSVFDIFLIYGRLNSKFRWVMKKELREIPFVGKACDLMGHIFIDRSSPMKARKSMDLAEKRLRNGLSIVIFPEGTRTKDGRMGRLKRGAFKMAQELTLPVVPVTIVGAYEVMPYGAKLIKPGKIKLVIHKPIETTNLCNENMDELIAQVGTAIQSAL